MNPERLWAVVACLLVAAFGTGFGLRPVVDPPEPVVRTVTVVETPTVVEAPITVEGCPTEDSCEARYGKGQRWRIEPITP